MKCYNLEVFFEIFYGTSRSIPEQAKGKAGAIPIERINGINANIILCPMPRKFPKEDQYLKLIYTKSNYEISIYFCNTVWIFASF